MEEEEGRQEAPRRGDAEEVVGGDGDEQQPGADGGDLHGVPLPEDRPPGTNICSVCHEPWASSGAHRIPSYLFFCIPCGHVYGRSCLELWLARSQSRSTTRGTPAAAAKCLWCGHEFRREDMINLYGATENLLEQQQQVTTEEEEQQQEEEEAPPAHDEAAAMEAEAAAARQWQQQAGHVHGHDLQEAAADAIARMMNQAAGVAVVARRNPNGEAAAAAGFSWRNGAVAWKRVGLAWRIDAHPPEDGDGDGAVAAAAAAGAPPAAAAGSSSRVVVLVELGVGILVFIVAALLCLIML